MIAFRRFDNGDLAFAQELNWVPEMDRPERGHVDYRKHLRREPRCSVAWVFLAGLVGFIAGWATKEWLTY